MLPKRIRGILLTALILGTLSLLAANTQVLAAPTGPTRATGPQAGASYVPGRVAQTLCVAGVFCSPVVAQLENPPASAALQGITQATLSYPGYSFGPVFLAHVGTPEGWGFYAVKYGDPILVMWTDGGTSAYRAVSARGYKLVDSEEMQDLSTGQIMTNLDVYSLNQSYPYLSLETCLPNPNPAGDMTDLTLGGSEWGRLFIMAEPLPGW